MVTVEGEESAGAQLGLRCPSKVVSGTQECHGKASSPRGQLGQEYSCTVGMISEQLALLRVSCLVRSMFGVGGKKSLDQEVQGNLGIHRE